MPFGDRLAPFGIVPLRLVHVAAGSCLTAWEGHGLHTQSPTEGRCGFWFGAVTHKATWDAHAVSLSVASSPQGKCPKTHVLGCVVPIGVPRERTNRNTEAGPRRGGSPWGAGSCRCRSQRAGGRRPSEVAALCPRAICRKNSCLFAGLP